VGQDFLNIPYIARKHMFAVTPLVNSLVIDIFIRFWQERQKTIFNPQLDGRRSGVFGATGTPEIKRHTQLMEFTDTRDNRWNRHALATGGADQGVVYVYKNDALFHGSTHLNLLQPSAIESARIGGRR
jgi:hypothetical protein